MTDESQSSQAQNQGQQGQPQNQGQPGPQQQGQQPSLSQLLQGRDKSIEADVKKSYGPDQNPRPTNPEKERE